MGVRGSRGRRIYLDNPKAADFQPEEIARSLAYENRYAGAYGPYSVAQHAVLVARTVKKLGGYPPQVLAGLHHDDSEAVTGDVPSPTKAILRLTTTAFDDLESRLMKAIDDRYMIDTSDPIVRQADALVFAWEVQRLVPVDARHMYEPLPQGPPGFSLPYVWFTPWGPDRAFMEYMDVHETITELIAAHTVPATVSDNAS